MAVHLQLEDPLEVEDKELLPQHHLCIIKRHFMKTHENHCMNSNQIKLCISQKSWKYQTCPAGSTQLWDESITSFLNIFLHRIVCVCVEVAAGCTVLALAFIFSNASNINKHPTSPSTTKSIVTPKKGGCLATSQTGNNKHVNMPRTSFKLRRKEKLNCHKILRAKLDKWLTYKIF